MQIISAFEHLFANLSFRNVRYVMLFIYIYLIFIQTDGSVVPLGYPDVDVYLKMALASLQCAGGFSSHVCSWSHKGNKDCIGCHKPSQLAQK